MRKLIAEGETVMDLINENENLIHCLKELRDELKIEELEKAIRNQEFNDTSYEELIYKKNQELARLFNRIYAVNQKIIDAYEPVKNRVACVSNMGNLPCGIIYMDLPLNRQNYLVQKFYQELFNKYVNNPGKYILLGLVPASNGRVLKIESLDDNERKYAQILDEYLRICFMDEQIEELINCIKMIQFNYISKDE